ncbi:hypothetical protein C9F11_37520 [Streptomyces sp. YIM 121038]|uniref:hypothetical protein n=1 Tax=Streptomyces sp. YIM 121038 TaxID=2136401 RepID=UPI001110B63F|nr:hypothetical protein [Streptomyces sp. YIM 121038]QCX81087.1 hypothetical protein C9F11_37520 [Streptomyces sp. YIM 121038]
MTPHHRALACRAGAFTLLVATAATAATPYWPAAFATVYGAAFLAWCGRREAVLDRRARVHARCAELAARPAPDCTRPAAARTLRDGAPLDAYERAVIASLEADFDHGTAA